MHRTGGINVEILRSREAMKRWVVRQIALTPVVSEDELEASNWFHEMALARRSRLITDLARCRIDGVNLREIATGPVGELLRRYPNLFVKQVESLEESFAEPEDALEAMAEPAFA